MSTAPYTSESEERRKITSKIKVKRGAEENTSPEKIKLTCNIDKKIDMLLTFIIYKISALNNFDSTKWSLIYMPISQRSFLS